MFMHVAIISGCFCAATAELSGSRDWSTQPEIATDWAFTEKVLEGD